MPAILQNHRILPGHMGGKYTEDNVIKLIIPEHASWHYELWCYFGFRQDYIAWQALSGQMANPELWLEKSKLGGNRKGNKRSNETKEKISKALKGRKISIETKRKLSTIAVGRNNNPTGFISEDGLKRLSELGKTLIGNKNPFFGKNHSEETKKLVSEKMKIYHANKRGEKNNG